jgi:hypothetical protein
MNGPVSLQDAVWNIAGAKAASPLPSACWSTLVEMFLGGELTATGRIGDPTNDHSPIPREAWPHIRTPDPLWFDPVETITGRLIFDVSVYPVDADSEAGSEPPARTAVTLTAEAANISLAGHDGGLVAAARWIASQGRAFSECDIREVLAVFGLQLADDDSALPSTVNQAAGSGRRPNLGLALATAKALEISENSADAKAPTLARLALAWLESHIPTITPPAPASLERAIYRAQTNRLVPEDTEKGCG